MPPDLRQRNNNSGSQEKKKLLSRKGSAKGSNRGNSSKGSREGSERGQSRLSNSRKAKRDEVDYNHTLYRKNISSGGNGRYADKLKKDEEKKREDKEKLQ
jgi:hypothetical protein